MEECFLRNTACQRKIGSPYPFLALCEEASSDGGAALAVMQQVNVVCVFIQNSMRNIAEGVHLPCSNSFGPEKNLVHHDSS